MKLLLIANDKQREGFKLSFDANTKEETETCKELAEKLIEKISIIEIKINNQQEEY
jgi:hypothetical protein